MRMVFSATAKKMRYPGVTHFLQNKEQLKKRNYNGKIIDIYLTASLQV